MERISYKGTYEQVKQQLCADYRNGDVELCSYFDAAVPNLTIEETVKLFAELRAEIDGDTVTIEKVIRPVYNFKAGEE